MTNTSRGFDIPSDVKARVDREIDKYYYYLEKMDMVIDEDEYYNVTAINYDRIMTSPTNNISKTTEMYAIRISDEREERDMAQMIVQAIDKGIEKSANSNPRLDRAEALRNDLFKNMVEKVPRHWFSRDTKTFAKYRRRAYYYIADELGLLS